MARSVVSPEPDHMLLVGGNYRRLACMRSPLSSAQNLTVNNYKTENKKGFPFLLPPLYFINDLSLVVAFQAGVVDFSRKAEDLCPSGIVGQKEIEALSFCPHLKRGGRGNDYQNAERTKTERKKGGK